MIMVSIMIISSRAVIEYFRRRMLGCVVAHMNIFNRIESDRLLQEPMECYTVIEYL